VTASPPMVAVSEASTKAVVMAASTLMPENLAARSEEPVSFSLTPKEVLLSTSCPTTTSTASITSGRPTRLKNRRR
jgi:hypothetical protein